MSSSEDGVMFDGHHLKLKTEPETKMKQPDHGFRKSARHVVMETHIINFVYGASFFMQASAFPYISRKLEVDTVVYGWIQTLFAGLQLTGNPLFGRFGDVFGAKTAMVVALTAGGLSHTLLGLSTNLTFLVISRFPAILMHGHTACQMVVTSVCESSKRAEVLGQLGVSFGMGMIAGPLVAGWLTKLYGEEVTALMAGAANLLSIPFVLTVMPRKIKQSTAHHPQVSENLKSFQKVLFFFTTPGALFFFFVRLFSAMPIGIFQSTFPVFAMDTFSLPPDRGGYFLSYIGVAIMVAQGVGVGFVTRTFSESTVLIGSSFFMVWSYLGLAHTAKIWQLYLVCMPLVFSLTILSVVTTSALTHSVSSDYTGTVLGLNMAIHSFVRVVSPTLGGYMLNTFGYPSIGYLGFIISLFVTFVLCIGYKRKPWLICAVFKRK